MTHLDASDTVAVRTGHGLDVGHALAGLGARSYAFTIDWHIRVLLVLAWLLLFVVLDLAAPNAFESLGQDATLLLASLPAATLYLLYHPVVEVFTNGSTPGKRIAGVRVVREDGGHANAGNHLVRNLFRLIDSAPAFYCIGLVSCLLTRQQVRLGDLAAGTVLVYDGHRAADLAAAIARSHNSAGRDAETAALVEDVLARWDALLPPRRIALACRLLDRAGSPVAARDDSVALHRALVALREGGGGNA